MDDFNNWLAALDKFFEAQFDGLRHDDFDDWLWHDEYKAQVHPLDAFLYWREVNDR